MEALLEMRGIVRAFSGVRALDGVDFTLRGGEIHALMGENGAGKSTLVKVMTGVYAQQAGTIRLAGREIRPRSPAHAQMLGISTVYQEVNLVPTLSVAENLFLGREPRGLLGIRWREVRRRASEAMAALDIRVDVRRQLGACPVAIQQMVAIARALDVNAKLLVLDEPTSSLDAHEVEQLFGVMRRLRERGLGIVFITHFLEQVYAIADRITVLRNGKLVGEWAASELPRQDLVSRMIGREMVIEEPAARGRAPSAAPVLEAKKLVRRRVISPIDLAIQPGEILGLAGLLGSGRTETARLLFGIDRRTGGELRMDDVRKRLRSPRHAMRLGIGLVPEDRKAQGIIPNLSVRENMILALQARRGWWRPIFRRRQRALLNQFISTLGIATASPATPIATLSGGNQQKVILARWLAARPRVLILDEPTRGIDVGAKAEVQRLMMDLARSGMAILFISSELEEIVRCCDRVAVLRDRAKVGELSGAEITMDRIVSMIAGAA